MNSPGYNFSDILSKDLTWTEGLSELEIVEKIKCAEFVAKAEWEGGFDEVALQWPSLVPAGLQWASTKFAHAKTDWENEVRWYLEHCGVIY